MREVFTKDAIAHLGRPAGRIPAAGADTTLRIAGICEGSVADGPGIRLVVFAQGCPHGCPGCHNPESHDDTGGTEIPVGELLALYEKNPLYAGITLSGGEPFRQADALAALARHIRRGGGSVVVYTGYTRKQLESLREPGVRELLKNTNLLIDGPYVEAKRSLELPYRGSANQRLWLQE